MRSVSQVLHSTSPTRRNQLPVRPSVVAGGRARWPDAARCREKSPCRNKPRRGNRPPVHLCLGARGCASDATCASYWGAPQSKCDRAYPSVSGWQCYSWVPGTLVNLLYGSNGASFDPASQIGAPNVNIAGVLGYSTRRNPFRGH